MLWFGAESCPSLQPHASCPSLQPRESHPSLQPHRRQLAGFPVLRLPTLPEPTSIVSVMPSNGITPWIPRRHNCKEMPNQFQQRAFHDLDPISAEAGRRAGTGRRVFLGEGCEGSPAARARLLRPPRPGCSSKEAGATGKQVGSELLGFKKTRLGFFPD